MFVDWGFPAWQKLLWGWSPKIFISVFVIRDELKHDNLPHTGGWGGWTADSYNIDIIDISQTCLTESRVQDYCLATTAYSHISMGFKFICLHKRRDENLVHSLQCLHETRLMAMLYFHIADRCQCLDILE